MNAITVAEYIWLDANKKFRSKVRTILHENFRTPELPDWDYDGSSTGQANGISSEIILVPIFVCDNPLLQDSVKSVKPNHVIMRKLVLCETFYIDGKPTPENSRHAATTIFDISITPPTYNS